MKSQPVKLAGSCWQKSHRSINTARSGLFRFTAICLMLSFCVPVAAQNSSSNQAVSALGRLEPQGGMIRMAAPSTPRSTMGGIISELYVEEGDSVSVGQKLATLDTAAVTEAAIIEAEAAVQLALREVEAASSQVEEACVRADVAQREADRRFRLHSQGLAGEEEMESSRGEAEAQAASCNATKSIVRSAEARSEVAKAGVNQARAQLERSILYSPIDGVVLDIKSRPGEFVTIEGAMILGDVNQMMAIAEIYETDIGRVSVGQRAIVNSAVFADAIEGKVHYIHQMVAKQDQMGTDPAARKDARIIEVEILLNESAPVAALTNLQVDIVINP